MSVTATLAAGPAPLVVFLGGGDILEVLGAHFVFFIERMQGVTGFGKLFHHFFSTKNRWEIRIWEMAFVPFNVSS